LQTEHKIPGAAQNVRAFAIKIVITDNHSYDFCFWQKMLL